jgi:HSP20 family protein
MAKMQKDRTKSRRRGESGDGGENGGQREGRADVGFHLGGLLGSFGKAVEKLVDLAEKGQDLSQTGELKGLDPQGKLRGVYGFSVKTALGGQGERELKIEPFGNIRRESSGETVVEDVREPLCDVYDEEDHVLVLAEIPGVSKKDVQLELAEDRLTIRAQRGEKRYHKEVVLPKAFSRQDMQWECANGMLKIRFQS